MVPLRGSLQNSDEYPCPFYMGVPPPGFSGQFKNLQMFGAEGSGERHIIEQSMELVLAFLNRVSNSMKVCPKQGLNMSYTVYGCMILVTVLSNMKSEMFC